MDKSVILVAFTIKPNCGSEQEVGWSWMIAYLRKGWHVYLMARDAENQKEEFQKWLKTPQGQQYAPQITPYFIKTNSVCERITWGEIHTNQKFMRLYFHVWQFWLIRPIKSILDQNQISHIHHCTFVSDTFIPFVGFMPNVPLIWGPIGGNRRLPRAMYLSGMQFLKNLGRDLARFIVWAIQPVRFRTSNSYRIIAHGIPIYDFVRDRLSDANIQMIPQCYVDDKEVERAKISIANAVYTIKDNENFVIYSAGPFIAIKNFDISINTLKLLKVARPLVKWELHLFGDGPLKHDLEKLTRESGLMESIHFHGWVDRTELYNFISTHADACLMPTYELGGTVPIESHIFGIPVFCLRGRSAGYYYENFLGTGVNVTRRSDFAQSLADAILGFKLTAENRRDGIEAIAHHSRERLTEYVDAIGS